jgi:hypothetical protein
LQTEEEMEKFLRQFLSEDGKFNHYDMAKSLTKDLVLDTKTDVKFGLNATLTSSLSFARYEDSIFNFIRAGELSALESIPLGTSFTSIVSRN